MLSIIVAAAILPAQKPFDFYLYQTYEARVPRPEKILGYEAGERLTNFRDQERVLDSIRGAASDRVKIIQYGESAEKRPLRIVVIGSPENVSRLDKIKADIAKLASGNPGPDKAAILKRTPAIVWINECIHGNEPASFESAMWLAYTLAASRSHFVNQILEKTIVVINPVFNPDGHERYVVFYDSVATGSKAPEAFERNEPGILNGRFNHYRFDMNRDHVAISQDETRTEIRELLKWNPQVYVDQHGQVGSYFFPPNPMSINENVDRARLNKWTDIFGRATGSAFDKNGWLYYVKDVFDFFAPVYTDTWATLSGAIGMTHETEGDNTIALEREDGSLWTMRDSIAKHFTSALAVIGSAAEHHDDLLASFATFKESAASGKLAGSFKRVIVQGERREMLRFALQLLKGGITFEFVGKAFSQPATHDYWSDKTGSLDVPVGALVIDMAQPQGALAKSLLEPVVDFEPAFSKEQLERQKKRSGDEQYPSTEGAEFYDLTGWSLPYAHNLRAWWSSETTKFEPQDTTPRPRAEVPDARVGWALEYRDRQDILAAADLLLAGVRVQIAPRPMTAGGVSTGRATFLILKARNDDDVRSKLNLAQQNRHMSFVPIETGYPESGRYGPGSENVASLKKPNIGVVFGDRASMTGFGSIWFLMEREWRLPFTALSNSALAGDLSKYTCIVLPGGQYQPASDKLKDWIRGGGCLVVLANPSWAIGEGKLVQLEQVKDKDKLPESIPGSLFRAQLDPRSFLSFGYTTPSPLPSGEGAGGGEIAVPVEGSTFYKTAKLGGAAVRLSTDEKTKKVLSGWEWPDTEKALTGAVWLHDQPYGGGHVIVFTEDPSDRAMWPGLYKLLLNAMILGPSF